ncbi:fatty acid desaturase [Parvibaculum sp.]|uniref:fatty acid desaturase family protein n=1 Tax=Parvibaculum sp. TaxID=2024848 RepID=UPI0025E5C9ED|nr:fatty acid desaturase [Parvibaculum sp.]
MSSQSTFWRHSDGAIPNTLAFSYVAVAHVSGIALLALANPIAWIAGTLLVAHSLIVAAYLIHDLAHMAIFRSRKLTLVVAEMLSWFCGGAYAPISRIVRMHMRHHVDKADLAHFDPRVFLKTAPGWLRRLVYALEWCYVPAVELIMHYQVVARPFIKKEFASERLRVLFVGLTRGAFFVFLFMLSPWALLGYAVAYMIFLTELFIADAYAHDYEFFLVGDANEKVSREGRGGDDYDLHHTYSNLISVRHPWLNLLNLNFGYHSVHHDGPTIPWYKLPEVHRQTYPADAPQVLPYSELWRSFHANRTRRIEAFDAGSIGEGSHRADGFLGVHGVSFLTVV